MTNQLQEFKQLCRTHLAAKLKERGQIIYSDVLNALKPNPVIFYGINPGQNPDILPTHASNCTLEYAIDNFPTGISLIESQPWLRKSLYEIPAGQAPYQIHVKSLLDLIKAPDAIVMNWFFKQAVSYDEFTENERSEWEDLCQSVHTFILQHSRPKLIITCAAILGDRPLFKELVFEGKWERIPMNEPRTFDNLELALFKNESINRYLLKIPQLSRYCLCHELQSTKYWIQNAAALALKQ